MDTLERLDRLESLLRQLLLVMVVASGSFVHDDEIPMAEEFIARLIARDRAKHPA